MQDIHDFVTKLAKPLFVFRMARGRVAYHAPETQVRSAETRMTNATDEIEELVLAYAEVIKKQRENR